MTTGKITGQEIASSITLGTLATTGNVTFSGGTVTINNGTSNAIIFGAVGQNAPNAGLTNTGTKIELYSSATDSYGIGTDASTVWYSTKQYHKWYTQNNGTGNPTLALTLDGSGNLTATGQGSFTDLVSSGQLMSVDYWMSI